MFFTIALLSIPAFGQQKYWIFLKDKDFVQFDPYQYFDSKAIERRQRERIPLNEFSDLPVREDYISCLKNNTEEVVFVSRWFNAICVKAKEEQIRNIENLNFVQKIIGIYMQSHLADFNFEKNLDEEGEELLMNQTQRMQGNLFVENGFNGKGIRIAIFDAGFPTVDTNPAFDLIRKEKRIIATYDFAKKKEFVYSYNTHGTMVFSCIGGMIDGKKIGLATGAEFLLARTEITGEFFSEEENWLAAVEWADKNGADIINSSLGYTYNRYFTEDMDGKTSMVSRAANMAAHKGILVVNAIGNDGTTDWKVLGAPADADSVLSVGGISPATDIHMNFSSYGPTSDFRMKPNISAYCRTVVSAQSKLTISSGTSFASPLIAGFAACAWQSKRDLKCMEMFREIEKSGNLYPYYDYAHGYGIPQANYFTSKDSVKTVSPTFSFVKQGDSLTIYAKKEFLKKEVHKYLSEDYMFYHIEIDNILSEYGVYEVFNQVVFSIPLEDLKRNTIIRVRFENYFEEYKIE